MVVWTARGMAFLVAASSAALAACASEEPPIAAAEPEVGDSSDDAAGDAESAPAAIESRGDRPGHGDSCREIDRAPTYADWPRVESRFRQDRDQEEWIA